MAQARQGQAGLGQSQGASLCLVLGLPSPPRVRREPGKELGSSPLLPSPTLKALPGTEAHRQGSSSYSPETRRGWPGGGSRGRWEPSLPCPPPPSACNPSRPASAVLLSLWPPGRALQVICLPWKRGSSLFLPGLTLLFGVISRWCFHLILLGLPRCLCSGGLDSLA